MSVCMSLSDCVCVHAYDLRICTHVCIRMIMEACACESLSAMSSVFYSRKIALKRYV